MTITTNQLQDAFDVLIANLVSNVGSDIDISVDEFWTVLPPVAYEMYSDPEVTLGSTSESWERLQSLLEDDPAVVGYGFVWLAQVLQAIGHEHSA